MVRFNTINRALTAIGLLALSACSICLQYNAIPENMRQLESNTGNTAWETDDARVP